MKTNHGERFVCQVCGWKSNKPILGQDCAVLCLQCGALACRCQRAPIGNQTDVPWHNPRLWTGPACAWVVDYYDNDPSAKKDAMERDK